MKANPPSLRFVGRTSVRARGRTLTFFGGCDYFRLSSHPQVMRAFELGLRQEGATVAASRATSGNHPVYVELERALAGFFRTPSAVLVSTGYAAPLALAQSLVGRFTHALIDAAAHCCLHDAVRLLNLKPISFRHRDAEHLRARLARLPANARPIVWTDGMFALTGELAPLAAYLLALPKHGLIVVDDAHGAGILGQRGRGTLEHLGVDSRRLLRTVTLSKAFGSFGGAILGERSSIRGVMHSSGLFVGSTPVPLPCAFAALAALHLLRRDASFRQRLQFNTAMLKTALRGCQWALPDNESPVLSFVPKTSAAVAQIRRTLLDHRVFPNWIRYPGGPASGYFRFVISSEHSVEEIQALISALTSLPCSSGQFIGGRQK